MDDYAKELEMSKSLADVWELVKRVVRDISGGRRAGLSLGLANLGYLGEGFIGAFYPMGSNIIVMNNAPLETIGKKKPWLLNSYSFHILLHEYIHALGVIDEGIIHKMVIDVCREAFGRDHLVTQLAIDHSAFIKDLIYPEISWTPPRSLKDMKIEMVEGFDRSSTKYIT